MTSREVKEKLLEALDLKVGDKIKLVMNGTLRFFEINEDTFGYKHLYEIGKDNSWYMLKILLDLGFMKLEKVGNRICDDFENCCDCPLRCINCAEGHTLYEKLNIARTKYNMPEGVYKEYKKLLDKEIE